MRAVRMAGAGRVELLEQPEPVPAPGQALIRIEASAVCGSERPAFLDGAAGNAGHEAAGIVEWAPARSGFEVGERVGVAAVYGCGGCPCCEAGLETRCRRGPVLQLGMHAERAAVDATSLRKLPAGTSAELAVLLSGDTLGVPARGLRRAPARSEAPVYVIGLGPVGLGHVAVRAQAGAEVLGIDPVASRRDLAAQLGAAETFAEPPAGRPAPLVIEASGRPAMAEAAFELCEPGGTVLQSGECHQVTLDASRHVIHREVSYVGSWYYASEDYPGMLRLQEQGLAIERLVTHRFAAGDAQAAFDAFFGGESGKVVIAWT